MLLKHPFFTCHTPEASEAPYEIQPSLDLEAWTRVSAEEWDQIQYGYDLEEHADLSETGVMTETVMAKQHT